jgi:hypothetical protein
VAEVATAVGLIGSVQVYGLVGVVLIYLGGAGFGMLMLYAALADGGEHDLPVPRVGLVSSLVLLVALGTISLLPIAGWFVLALVGATSPLVTNQLAPSPRRRRPPTPDVAAAREQARVDAAFEELVDNFEQDGSRGTDGTQGG